MKVLFIGGTGNISGSCTNEALRHGVEVVHFNRGQTKLRPGHSGDPSPVRTIHGDVRDTGHARELLGKERFDCVVDWIAFTPEHVRQDMDLFRDRTDQFLFISSASVYHKPPRHHVVTESTPAFNPFWKYSQDKIECERLLVSEYESAGFPITIVRPSHTYSDAWFPTSFHCTDFTIAQRMLDGRPVLVHGDGQSLWTITHADDFAKGFAGLLGNPAAIGETVHITSDEQLTWDQMHQTIAGALGTKARIVHVASETIARLSPANGPSLLGDKQYSLVFDNSKVKRLVPGYQATIPFFEGVRRTAASFNASPERKAVNRELDSLIDDIIEKAGLSGQ